MTTQDYFDIVSHAKKEFDGWIKLQEIRFKCLQFVFPFIEDDKEITAWIFFLNDVDVFEYEKNGTVNMIKEKFGELLLKNGLPVDLKNDMKFKVDSHENVQNNYEGNYFFRLR